MSNPLVKYFCRNGYTHRIGVAHDTITYWGYMASSEVKNPELLAAYVDNIMSVKSCERRYPALPADLR